jgi:cell division protein FtsL
MENNKNINKKSIKSLNEFNEKKIKSYIKFHKIFLSIIIIINLVLIVFIAVYKSKISKISKMKLELNDNSSKRKTNYISTLSESANHKLVNILVRSISPLGNYHFSLIFENSEEVDIVKEMIRNYKQLKDIYLFLIYQGKTDSDDSKTIFELIKFYSNILMMVETGNGEKFGFFFNKAIIPNKNSYFESDSYDCFIFSLKDKAKYYAKVKKRTFEINKEFIFNIGNGDIEINHNYHRFGGNINFPFKSFYIPENKGNIFNKMNGKFEIKDIEIYLIMNEDYDYYDLRRIILS